MISPALRSSGSSHLPLGRFMYAKPSEGLKGHDKLEGNLGRYRISGLCRFVPGLNNINMFLHAKKGIYLNILGGFFFNFFQNLWFPLKSFPAKIVRDCFSPSALSLYLGS